jgi:hypothetical protein
MKPRFLLAPTSFPSRMATSPLLATTFHHEGKIVHANFPSNTSTMREFPITTLHRKGKHKCIGKNNYIAS